MIQSNKKLESYNFIKIDKLQIQKKIKIIMNKKLMKTELVRKVKMDNKTNKSFYI